MNEVIWIAKTVNTVIFLSVGLLVYYVVGAGRISSPQDLILHTGEAFSGVVVRCIYS